MKRLLLFALLLVLNGCVYYNGMYNTKQFAKRARKAEREGRTFDAANFWGQVSVKSESLLVKHPRSKYAEEARLLHGIARARLNDCSGAMSDLESVMLTSQRLEFAEQAAEVVGQCRVVLGEPASAAAAYARLTSSANAVRRDLALYAHGQALRLNGDYTTALSELQQSSHPRARGERAAALAGLGRTEDAAAVIESLFVAKDTLAPWPEIVNQVGRHDTAMGSTLANRLFEWDSLPGQVRARVLIDDAIRVSESDPARRTSQLERAASLGAAGADRVAEARVLLIRRRLHELASVDSLKEITTDLLGLSEGAGSFTPVVMRLSQITSRAAAAADSVIAGEAEGDMRLFMAAELARDSLDAPVFARLQFERVITEWPSSPFAPKALLALILLEPQQAEVLQQRLRATYPGSPYLRLVDGTDTPELTALEDSLERYVLGFQDRRAPGIDPARPGARPNRPRPLEPQ